MQLQQASQKTCCEIARCSPDYLIPAIDAMDTSRFWRVEPKTLHEVQRVAPGHLVYRCVLLTGDCCKQLFDILQIGYAYRAHGGGPNPSSQPDTAKMSTGNPDTLSCTRYSAP